MSSSLKCCSTRHEVSPEMICELMPEIVDGLRYLCRRQKKIITKRPRIHQLSMPKQRNPKYTASCPCRFTRDVTIVRMDQPIHTRTEQLAYPQVSRLMQLKKHASYPSFPTKRKISVNRLIHRSLHSLYSRLSNTQPPVPPSQTTKWTPEEWAVHKHYNDFLAKPKKAPEVSEETPPTKPFSSLRRYKKLARHRVFEDTEAPKWYLTQGMRNYLPTKRIKELCQPRPFEAFDYDEAFRVKREALSYRATERIKTLATAPPHLYKTEERENPYMTSRNALRAKTSPRIEDLAQPKSYMDNTTRSDPYKVSRGALHAKISPRVAELAQPKVYAK